MFYVGCHMSKTGGYSGTAKRILEMGGNTYQVFTRNPRGSGGAAADPADLKELNRIVRESGMHPPLAHAPYIYNP